MSDEICFMTATELARKIRERGLSAREVMEAHLAQIERVNPKVNAIITQISDEAALNLADAADAAVARGEDLGPLHGLPIAHKDTEPTAGMRTTWGSPIFRDNVPDDDSLSVERLKRAGALSIGKTNVPEFAAGSQTFNEVFGATLNPYDLTKTCGGSSGGAAVALACGMMPIADGSDHGGSLRNPGSFNNVVGFRPSPGRVPSWPSQLPWYALTVKGPLGRTVEDVALMLSAMAGPDPRAPLSIYERGEIFAGSLARDFRGARIAWSPNLGDLPVDPRVTETLEAALPALEDIGCTVELATPDFSEVDEAYRILRAWTFAINHADNYERHRDQLKASIVQNIEQGRELTGMQLGWAEVKRAEMYYRMGAFFADYDFLVCPVSQVPPFDVTTEYPTEIAGVEMEDYLAWMKSSYYISFTTLPAISVPAGFTSDGLPVGLQIVGPYRDDLGVLQLAHAFESATNQGQRRPPIVEED